MAVSLEVSKLEKESTVVKCEPADNEVSPEAEEAVTRK
jgi:hypothetical protein